MRCHPATCRNPSRSLKRSVTFDEGSTLRVEPGERGHPVGDTPSPFSASGCWGNTVEHWATAGVARWAARRSRAALQARYTVFRILEYDELHIAIRPCPGPTEERDHMADQGAASAEGPFGRALARSSRRAEPENNLRVPRVPVVVVVATRAHRILEQSPLAGGVRGNLAARSSIRLRSERSRLAPPRTPARRRDGRGYASAGTERK
jgi:hypothetical protein